MAVPVAGRTISRLAGLSRNLTICPACTRRLPATLPRSISISAPFRARIPPRPRRLYSTKQSTPKEPIEPPPGPQPGDSPHFTSPLDAPARTVRIKRQHRPAGLIILALIPLTAFALGTWQIQRLNWKTSLISKFEDRLLRPPLPLPPSIDPSAIPEFDYRRVVARGVFRHDQEMLIGPRLLDGTNGYVVVTPLDRSAEGGSTILVNRGWISKELAEKRKRRKAGAPDRALPQGVVTVEGLLREAPLKNMFTPDNRPEKGEFYFPDVKEMSGLVGAQEVLVEETMHHTVIALMEREAKGIPIGRVPEVTLRNNHFQYIVTWYSLGIATSIMFYLVIRKPPREIARKVQLQRNWS